MRTHEVYLKGYEAVSDGILFLGTQNSYGTERLHITSDEAWDGLTITAVFSNGSCTEVAVDRNGMVAVPPEALVRDTDSCFGRIVFKGASASVQRVSTDLFYRVYSHASETGDNTLEPTENQYAQFVEQVKHEADRAEAAAERAEDVGNTVDGEEIKQHVFEYLEKNPVQPTELDSTLTKENAAAQAGAVGAALLSHDSSDTAHGGIAQRLNSLTLRTEQLEADSSSVNAVLDDMRKATFEQENEIKGLSDSKLNRSEVVNSLNSAAEDKPLSAAKGAELREMLDERLSVKESTEHSGCFFRECNGTVQWLNPPMLLGEEYATLKRRNGRVVYRVAIDFGTLPNASNAYATNVLPPNVHDVTLSGYVHSTGVYEPLQAPIVTELWATIPTDGSRGYIGVTTDADQTAYTAVIFAEYTKG